MMETAAAKSCCLCSAVIFKKSDILLLQQSYFLFKQVCSTGKKPGCSRHSETQHNKMRTVWLLRLFHKIFTIPAPFGIFFLMCKVLTEQTYCQILGLSVDNLHVVKNLCLVHCPPSSFPEDREKKTFCQSQQMHEGRMGIIPVTRRREFNDLEDRLL